MANFSRRISFLPRLSQKNIYDRDSETSLLLDEGLIKRETTPRTTPFSRKLCIGISLLLLLSIGLGVGVTLSLILGQTAEKGGQYTQEYSNAAVATDSAICSQVGANLMKDHGGNAIDGAIGSLFCLGVVQLQSTGIGGGGFMTIYNESNRQTTVIDFREKAPAIISDEAMERYLNDPTSTTAGGLAIGVPGEIKGMYEAHQLYGRLSWSQLIEPSIDIARDGFAVTPPVAAAIIAVKNRVENGNFTGLSELLFPSGRPLQEGDILRQPELANTLQSIANFGPDYFYNSDFTIDMVNELQAEYGAILTVEDFNNYEVVIREALISEYEGFEIHAVPPPASGAVLALVLNILQKYKFTSEDLTPLSYHRIVEAFKFAYGQRLDLGDPDFNDTIKQVVDYMMNPETANFMHSLITDSTTHDVDYYLQHGPTYNTPSHGTTHLSVLDEEGNAIAITSTVNTLFGSYVRSTKSGIIFNDEMDDFSVEGRNNSYGYPPSPSNYLRPSRRPLSSTTPTIITRDGKVVMVTGAAGGSRIPTSTIQVLLNVLSFSLSLDDAMSRPRLHHQLIPNYVTVENDFPSNIIQSLEEKQHAITKTESLAVVQTIYKEGGIIYASSDRRKGGKPSGY